MAARRVRYVAFKVPRRAGTGAGVLKALRDAGVDLRAFSGFPEGSGRAQVDLVTEDIAGVRRVAKQQGWRLGPVKKAFVIQGRDQVGAVYRQVRKLAAKGIRITAAQAVAAGGRRYGMILWVRSQDYARAARALGAR